MGDINALIAGFKSFQKEYTRDGKKNLRKLAEYGPHSRILMIACCDSRVDPAIITNSAAGNLMVIRNMANLVPPFDSDSPFQETQAALEFASLYLNVEHIIVMGHSRCGGIRSLLTRLVDDADAVLPLDKWTAVAEPAAREVLEIMPGENLDDQACACSRRALVASLDNLLSYPWVAEKLQRGMLEIHGWYFNLAEGDLQRYNKNTESFESLY